MAERDWDSEEKWKEKKEKNRRFSSEQLYLVQQQNNTQSTFSKFASPKAVLTEREGQFSVLISMHTYNTY